MSIKTVALGLMLLSPNAFAGAQGFWGTTSRNQREHQPNSGNNGPQRADCSQYNTDGRTCSDGGFSEGQPGFPWGQQAGEFRCENTCLRYVQPGQ